MGYLMNKTMQWLNAGLPATGDAIGIRRSTAQ
jgi:hypothetical protein